VARAKRTDRTDARRRYRAEQAALVDEDPGTEDEAAAPRSASTAKAATSTKSAPAPAPAARPSITAPMRGAYRPVHVVADLKSLPPVITNIGFRGAVGLTIVAGAWFVLAYNDAMAAIPVGTATQAQIEAAVGSNTIPLFLGQMAFLTPPPAIGAFLIGFTAKRASWLGGFIYGLIVVIVAALILQTQAGRILTGDQPGATESLIVGHLAFSPIGAALFASLLAWYRRFLDLANPNRAQRTQPPKRQQGRGDMKPVRR
jgi:hypothetical protein